jgi:hypothetical protein
MPTTLKGFGGPSKKIAVHELVQKFGPCEFNYQDAMKLEHVDAQLFAKLRCDGVLIKIGKLWPARWKIAQRYLALTL